MRRTRSIMACVTALGLGLGLSAQAGGVRELPLSADYCSILYALTNAADDRCKGSINAAGMARGVVPDPLVALPFDGAAVRPRARPVAHAQPAMAPEAATETAGMPRSAETGGGYFIRFGLNSDVPAAPYRRHLETLADVLRSDLLATTCLRLVGHTDASGAADYNRALGLRRAKGVGDILAADGAIAFSRIDVVSLGEDALLPDLPANDPLHRRVEVLSRGMTDGGCG